MAAFGPDNGIEPAIVTARLHNQTVLVLPLAVSAQAGAQGGARTLSFLGEEHGNQNTGLWERSFYDRFQPDQALPLLREIGSLTRADTLALRNMPRHWHGRPHPLVLPSAVDSPNAVYRSCLAPSLQDTIKARMSKSARKNLDRKRRHLEAAGEYCVTTAKGTQEIRAALETFLNQRNERFRQTGIPGGFADPTGTAFLEALVGLGDAQTGLPPQLQIWTLRVAGAIRATCLATRFQDTLYAYSNSVAHDRMLKHSPGIVLIRDIVERACADPQIRHLDLGIGAERYKTDWTDAEPLADTYLGLTLRGRANAATQSGRIRLKKALRNSRTAWPLIKRLRKLYAVSRFNR